MHSIYIEGNLRYLAFLTQIPLIAGERVLLTNIEGIHTLIEFTEGNYCCSAQRFFQKLIFQEVIAICNCNWKSYKSVLNYQINWMKILENYFKICHHPQGK